MNSDKRKHQEPLIIPNSSSTFDNRSISPSTEDGTEEEGLVDCLLTQVDDENVSEIIGMQKKCLDRLENTNEVLDHCQKISDQRFEETKNEVLIGQNKILMMKNDLEYVIRKIAIIKKTLKERYPKEYATSGSLI
uniref:KxDL domain-containing protein n=1 Tax=Rhabditophanes sp. KR3021 TaxID=114890 RepID=A0AC35TL77_9BILA